MIEHVCALTMGTRPEGRFRTDAMQRCLWNQPAQRDHVLCAPLRRRGPMPNQCHAKVFVAQARRAEHSPTSRVLIGRHATSSRGAPCWMWKIALAHSCYSARKTLRLCEAKEYCLKHSPFALYLCAENCIGKFKNKKEA